MNFGNRILSILKLLKWTTCRSLQTAKVSKHLEARLHSQQKTEKLFETKESKNDLAWFIVKLLL